MLILVLFAVQGLAHLKVLRNSIATLHRLLLRGLFLFSEADIAIAAVLVDGVLGRTPGAHF